MMMVLKKIMKKKTAKKAAKTAAKVAKTATKAKPKKRGTKKPTAQELFTMIEKKAYLIAEKRGFCQGDDWSDWYKAEKLVKASLKK